MTREEIEAGVERLRPWFHQIDLGHGIKTKTASAAGEHADHPLPTWEYIRRCLPEDLTGKSVIDIGCNAGFYSVEAKRRNAARVLGVDAQRHQVRQAQFVRRALGLDIEFRRMSVYDLTPRTVGTFDVTLALGLVYHLKHLVLALENLFQITRELLILETAILMSDGFLGEPTYPGSTQKLVLHPMAYIENATDAKEQVFNWFLPSPKAMEALLRNVGFEDVSIFSVHGDRAVLVCRKRDVVPDGYVLSQLAGRVTIEDTPARCGVDAGFSIFAKVENTGLARWLASGEPKTGKGAIRLGAHLLGDGEVVAWEFGQTSLSRDLLPGESELLEVRLLAPSEPGSYAVELDLLAEHLSWFEDLGSNTVQSGLEVVPFAPTVPWYRSEGVLAGLDSVSLPAPSPDASPSEVFAVLLDGVVLAMSRLSSTDAVRLAFEWILGQSPDSGATAHYSRALEAKPDGARKLVREFLLRDADSVAPAPDSPRLQALAERMGSEIPGSTPEAARGESFVGEAGFARRLLEEGRGLDDQAFVDLAYRKVLGRQADPGGREYFLGKLQRKELNRPHLLRELFWSDELRGTATPEA